MWGRHPQLVLLSILLILATLIVTGTLDPTSARGSEPPVRPDNVAPRVWHATAADGETSFLLLLREQADLSPAPSLPTRAARSEWVVDRLRRTAQLTQPGLRSLLDRRGVSYRAFYVVNALVVTGDRQLVAELAARPEVDRIAANPSVRVAPPEPLPIQTVRAPTTVEWGVAQVNADDVWVQGITGQGVVVAGQDTGYDWDHPALVEQYRGWNGITATHDYHWHDAIHTNEHGTNVCGVDSPEPCDDHGHGTHTMGTMVGDDGGENQIGVAPGAEWIGCRNMDRAYGTPATYIECFEFFLAPYPVGGDPLTDGRPDLAPDVINNSWGCPPYEGCDPDTLRAIVETVRAAGILVVTSAGNSGSSCGSVDDPPAIYEAAFSVGATTISDTITSFSSRGPVTVDGSYRRKPDVSAPGYSVRSSIPGGGYAYMNGTSMASPHVSGVAALLWSAAPYMIGDVDGTEAQIEQTARPQLTDEGCGGDSPTDVPNHVYGWGVVDALAAVEAVEPPLTITKQAALEPWLPVERVVYTIVVANTTAITLTDVVVTDTLPAGAPLAWAKGIYTETSNTLTWEPAEIPPGDQLTATLAVTVAHLTRGSLVSNPQYGVRATEMSGPVIGPPVETLIPWRLLLLPVFRQWQPSSR
jgi:subtilisin family serine protease